jgi:hypothetical protein
MLQVGATRIKIQGQEYFLTLIYFEYKKQNEIQDTNYRVFQRGASLVIVEDTESVPQPFLCNI